MFYTYLAYGSASSVYGECFEINSNHVKCLVEGDYFFVVKALKDGAIGTVGNIQDESDFELTSKGFLGSKETYTQFMWKAVGHAEVGDVFDVSLSIGWVNLASVDVYCIKYSPD